MNGLLGDIRDYGQRLGQETVSGWNRFWFTPRDPATLGLLRILTGLMLLWTHLVWTAGLAPFFAPDGFLSPKLVSLHHGSAFAWSWLWVEFPWLLGLHVIALVTLLLFTLGLFTRVTSVLAFLITVAYAHRAPATVFGLDQINAMLALYLAIGPSGAAYSLDAWLWPKSPSEQASTLANVAIRLMQVHLCVIYFFAGAGKLLGDTWWSGDALWLALASYEYQSLDVTWLAHFPWLLQLLAHATVVWELTYCFLVWPSLTRPLIVALSVPMHLGIAVAMGMTEFGLIMIVANLAFLDSAFTRRLLPGFSHDSQASPQST